MDEVAFGRYRLIEVIGLGGMGKVYKAYDTPRSRWFGRWSSGGTVSFASSASSVKTGYSQRFSQ